MSNSTRNPRALRLAIGLAGLVIVCAGVVYPRDAGSNADVMQFDAVLELHAPSVGTDVTLFARYWVSPDFYCIGFRWAEPSIGVLNFPGHPPGTIICSNDREFAIECQINENQKESFAKPLGDRGVFRNVMNAYPFAELRFAEAEALSTRVYTRDLSQRTAADANDWRHIEIAPAGNRVGAARGIAALDVCQTNGQLETLKAFDANGIMLEQIEYGYSTQNGSPLLRQQQVMLPERRMTVGFQGKGATVTIGNRSRTFRELPGVHHPGGRRCTVEYQTMDVQDHTMSVPSRISVRRADTNAPLRIATIANCVRVRMSCEEAARAARDFSRLDAEELEVRELFAKYRTPAANAIEEADSTRMEQLRRHFASQEAGDESVCDMLRHTSMLMKLDWLQGSDDLQEHAGQYFRILDDNPLGRMVLWGGLDVIETTVRCNRFSDADELLKRWAQHASAASDPNDVMSFLQVQFKRGHYWTIANLLDNYLKSNARVATEQFDLQTIRCLALAELNTLAKDPSQTERERVRSQIRWALHSTTRQELADLADSALAEANRLYSELPEPTEAQARIKMTLDQMGAKETGP